MPPQSSARVLEPDKPARFELPAVGSRSLFQGEQAFRIWAPAGTGKLVIKLRADDLASDVDLFVRYGEEATIEHGHIVSDYSSTGETGEEEIVISDPKAGIYFINLGTTGVAVQGTLTASLSSASALTGGVQTIRKAAFATADGGEPVSAKPAARTVLTVSADVTSQTPGAALLSRPALSKGTRIKRLIPLASLER